jgi:hypothetical protein
MDGLYPAVLMNLGSFPMKGHLQFPGLYTPATYAQVRYKETNTNG